MKTLNIFLAVAMMVVVLGCGGRKADVDEVITIPTEADTIAKNTDEMQEEPESFASEQADFSNIVGTWQSEETFWLEPAGANEPVTVVIQDNGEISWTFYGTVRGNLVQIANYDFTITNRVYHIEGELEPMDNDVPLRYCPQTQRLKIAEVYYKRATIEKFDFAKVYKQWIEDLENISGYYAIFDIDGNGVPELLVTYKEGNYDIFTYIFTIVNGSLALIFEPPFSRYGSSEVLSSGLIVCALGENIYKISNDGSSVIQIARAEPYDYPNEASRAEAKWRYYVNNAEVEFEVYVQFLKEQGYNVGKENIKANIKWIEF